MSEEDLKARIAELEKELESKQKEIYEHLDRIDQLEDNIMKYEASICEENHVNMKKVGKKAKETKLLIELEEKEKIIRDLKDKMGFLRKEKVQYQQELEKIIRETSSTTLIRIEEKKVPLEILVKELQNKINKQNIIIKELENQTVSSEEFKKKLKHKKTKIKFLRAENIKSNQNLLSLKKLFEFKNEIINELISHFNSNLLQLKDPNIDIKIKNIQSMNEKLNKHIEQFQ